MCLLWGGGPTRRQRGDLSQVACQGRTRSRPEAERAVIGNSLNRIPAGLELTPEAGGLVLSGPALVLGTGLHFNFLLLLDLKLTEIWQTW